MIYGVKNSWKRIRFSNFTCILSKAVSAELTLSNKIYPIPEEEENSE
jgi:hypothetical protein